MFFICVVRLKLRYPHHVRKRDFMKRAIAVLILAVSLLTLAACRNIDYGRGGGAIAADLQKNDQERVTGTTGDSPTVLNTSQSTRDDLWGIIPYDEKFTLAPNAIFTDYTVDELVGEFYYIPAIAMEFFGVDPPYEGANFHVDAVNDEGELWYYSGFAVLNDDGNESWADIDFNMYIIIYFKYMGYSDEYRMPYGSYENYEIFDENYGNKN